MPITVRIMLGEMNAKDFGQVAASVLIPACLILLGASKCYTISLRPGTSRKCALALMFALLALFGSYLLGAINKFLTATPYYFISNLLTLIVSLGLAVTALVLGIKGLGDFAKSPGQYVQGRPQAGWAIAMSLFLLLFAGLGIVQGIRHRAANAFLKPIPVVSGTMLKFADYNFRFRAPEHPWVAVAAGTINKDSKAAFMRVNPEMYFIILPEALGADMTSKQLAELGKAHVSSAASSSEVVQETPLSVNNLNGILVETDAQVGKFHAFYVQWYMATNGYAYQLMGYGKIDDRQRIESGVREILPGFALIDPARIADSKSHSFSTNYISPSHFYTVTVAHTDWHDFPALKESFPEAEFGASQGDSCFVVLPVWLGNQKVDMDVLAAGLLTTMNITYPDDDFTHRQIQGNENQSSLQVDYQRTIDNSLYRYRIKITHAGEFAYLAAAWTKRNEENADSVLSDALNRIKISPPTNSLSSNVMVFSDRDRKNQSRLLNETGLNYFNSAQYKRALPLFHAANVIAGTNSDYICNLLLTFSRLDQPKEGLNFLASQPTNLMADPNIVSFEAYFQSKCSLTEAAITNYARIFSAGYRSETDFKDYINLLIDNRQYDRALAEVDRYLQAGDTLSIRLLKAGVYRDKKNYGQAIAILKAEHDNAPFNAKITEQLIEAMLDAGQPNEALVYANDLVTNDRDSYLPYYLKAQCEINLKWYREAKESLEQANKLEAANEDVKSDLTYVSGLLGEGSNSMLKDPIEPILLPEILTNHMSTVPTNDYARDFGAFYKQRIKALSYGTNNEFKTTDYLLIHVVDAVGVAAYSTYQVGFDPLGEDIFVNDARVLSAAGETMTTVKSSDCYVIDDTTYGKVSSQKILNIPIAGLKAGCDVSLVITRRSGGNQEGFPFLEHCFSESYPVLTSGVFIRGDGSRLKIRTSPGIDREHFKDGIYWAITNPMVDWSEPLQPPSQTYLPMIWISDGGSDWAKLATNYLASIQDRLLPDETLKLKARQLVAGLDDNSSKISALSRFVQTNCTYKAIEFGRHSRTPRAATDTLRNSYGDCKDHAVLLQQLLKDADIPANLTLISSINPVQVDLPSLDQFNHMIVEIPLKNGERFIDGTDKASDLACVPPLGLAGQQALVLNPDNPHLVKLSDYSTNASAIEVLQHGFLRETNDLALDETLNLTGVHAAYLREYLLGISPAYRQESLQRDMGLSHAVMTKCDIASLEDPKQPLQISCSLIFKNQFHSIPRGHVGTLPGGLERFYLTATPVNKRATPFEITTPLRIHFKITFDLPKDYHLIEKSEPGKKLDPRFITFESQHELQDAKLSLRYQIQLLVGRYKAADYSSYWETMEQVHSLMDYEVNLQAD